MSPTPETEGLSEYEKKRLENIQRNQRILAALEIPTLTTVKKDVTSTSGTAAAKKARKRNKSPPPIQERRVSTRIQEKILGMAKKMSIAEELAMYREMEGRVAAIEKPEKAPRPPRVLENIPFDPEEGATEDFLCLVKNALESSRAVKPCRLSGERRYRIDGSFSVAKVLQDRIYSMAIHPNTEKILVTCGSKMGAFSLWDATDAYRGDATERRSWYFSPHAGAISNQRYNPVNDSQLFLTSYDGSIRCFDMKKGEFTLVHALEETNVYISALDISKDGNLLHFTDTAGQLTVLDRRAPSKECKVFQLHEKKAGGLSISPVDNNLIATSSLDDTICLWDMRKLLPEESPIMARFEYRRAVTSVNFHPCLKDVLVSTCYDDHVRIHTNLLADTPNELQIVHNNQTGRWITPFRAVWDPKSTSKPEESHILVGDMNRGLDVIEMATGLVTNNLSELLTSQPAVNVAHPKLDLIASGNASGKCILWKPQ